MSSSKLFQPIRVGDITLHHRVVLAPLTRFRANADHVVGDHHVLYYAQRSSVPGTLLISEANMILLPAGGYRNVPGIYNDEQIAAWKKVTNAVHANGSFIYLQLWAQGRTADPDVLAAEGPHPYVAASDIKLTNYKLAPRPLTILEIKEYVQWYAKAASNAVHKAGFDGVEVHGANGYLIDQFLQDVSNRRTDEYGGSMENRVRFGLEVVDAVVKAVGAKKTGVRISPWGRFQDMRMHDPVPTFAHFVTRLRDLYPDLAYIHTVEPRWDGQKDVKTGGESNDFIREIWSPRPLITGGGFTRELGLQTADEKGDIIAYGRLFISNPDLPRRIKEGISLTPGDRSTYYAYASSYTDPKGYTDYPFAEM